jgi:MoaA/NifB/PqqE/SkfB family radical SAM enzyme
MNPVLNPLNVHMYLTPLCNLACSHCYYDAKRIGDDPGRMLSVDDVVDTISWLCKKFEADLHLEGGEIFLRPDLDQIFAKLAPEYLSLLTVTTSGIVPMQVSKERLRALGDLRISVEGHTDELQQMLRPANLDRVFRTTEMLRTNAIPFSLRVTLHRANVRKIQEMITSFVARGVERISFFEYQPVGRGLAQINQHTLSDADFEFVLDTLIQEPLNPLLRVLKLSLSQRRVAMALERQSMLEDQGFKFIELTAIPNLTINSNGDLGISPWLATATKLHDCFANIFETDFRTEIERRFISDESRVPCPYTSEFLLRYKV